MTVRVVLVCTANHCRSPLAHHLLAERVSERGMDWEVVSAGTHAAPGNPMHPMMQASLEARGIAAAGFRSQPLSAEVARESLLLPMTDRHRSWIVGDHSAAIRRTFTFLQFAHLAAALAPGDLAGTRTLDEVLDAIAEARSRVQPLTAGRDVRDPIGGSAHDFGECITTIAEAVDRIIPIPVQTDPGSPR